MLKKIEVAESNSFIYIYCRCIRSVLFEHLWIYLLFQDTYTLETLYSSVDDIDFIVGALLETPEDDSFVGNTTRCIIGDFFYRSRIGDRFFYDNEGQSGQFSKCVQFILCDLYLLVNVLI